MHLVRRHFSLLGGWVTYLDQTPGANLIYGGAEAPHFRVRVPGTVIAG
jgi:hypothetical protein